MVQSAAAAATAVVVLVWAAGVQQATAILSTLGGFASSGAATSVGISAAGAAMAAGAAAVAAAGIAGLGIAAVAFKYTGRKFAGHDPSYSVYHYGYHDDGYGYQDLHHHHGGGGYGGYSHYRRRRSTREAPTGGVMDSSDSMGSVFGVVGSMDTFGCGLRLVCALHASPAKLLTHKEISVRDLVSPEEYVWSSQDPRYPYVQAARAGAQGYDCASTYPACPLTSKQAKLYLNSLSI